MCPESPAQDSADVAARNQQTTERENNATQHAACRVANNEHKITAQMGGTASASAGARGKGEGHGKGKGGEALEGSGRCRRENTCATLGTPLRS